jgi:hypothetical protein
MSDKGVAALKARPQRYAKPLDTVMNAARVLNVYDRDDFLRAVAHELAGRELGDGVVGRVCAELQKRFWRPPVLDGKPVGSKYGR